MTGERGQPGEPGERGPTGDKGAHGQHGDTGDIGLTGDTGLQGTPGVQGITGERGAHGDTGQTGQQGRRGSTLWLPYVLMGLFVIVVLGLSQVQFNRLDRLAHRTDKIARDNERTLDRTEDLARDTAQALAQNKRESRERRDQSCKGDERDHLTYVKRLRRTYEFLTGPVAKRQPDLAALALQQLPELERQARIDQAPRFCDEPGIGLKEPDPVVPKRPKSLR